MNTTVMQAGTQLQSNKMTQKVLLFCGILSSLLYIAMNIFIPMHFPGYSTASQTVSELSAIGAPTRHLWIWLSSIYTLLILAFGWGVWQAAPNNRPLRFVGILIFLHGIFDIFWPFAPMHLRGAEFTTTDAMHIALGIVTVLLMMLIFGFAAVAFTSKFRIFSIISIIVFIVFGTLTGLDGPRIAANLPTPWIGIWERINIGVFMLWLIVLAIVLLRAENKSV
jgi:Protein of unknown function (DUF998)